MLLDVNSFKKGDLYVSFKTVEEFCCDNDIYFERILIEL